MKRLIVGKNEIAAEIVEKIIDEPDDEITLVVPKNSTLSESVSNFHLLKREADGLGKKIAIESVDSAILVMAKSSRIEAAHPLLDREKRPSFSDIIPRFPRKKSEDGKIAAEDKTVRLKIVETEAPYEAISEIRDTEFKISGRRPAGKRGGEVEIEAREREVEKVEIGEMPKKRRFVVGRGLWIGVVVAIAAVAVVVFIMGKYFSRATIQINFNKTPWTYGQSFTADTAISKINADKSLLPAEFFSTHKNITQLFPASGKATVSERASGKITIYNAYSSKSQTLVSMTRFSTTDGKIFRLIDQVVVPGAQITNGKIIPASIVAEIIADKAGPEYNIGPVKNLTIPGFKGTPRYDGFYGDITDSLRGGFTGQKAVPTADDISKAKNKTTEILKTSLENSFLTSYPSDFKILDGASNFNATKLSVNEKTDANGNFSVFGEADFQAIGFKESDLKALLLSLAAKDNPKNVFIGLKLNYDQVKADFKKKIETFSLSASGVLTPDFAVDDFKVKILGKNMADVKSLISTLPGLSSARVSLWPIWLSGLPSEIDKIKVDAN